ncbi:DUF423 domain-containing protein [Candidatus Marinamargulisbacteria bacterium SCGC AG-439-L15]|nr:DUF423 domain-containing protein [Candidatus Marinamargulisbacteria bacterium SCGC AG-439-L15]
MTALRLGLFFAGTAVALGAFGAHGLKTVVSADLLQTFKTGVTYQMWHAIGLCLYGLYSKQKATTRFCPLFWFSIGIGLFSGSLYLLVLTERPFFGIITPIGGVCLMIGWARFFHITNDSD